jgi:hypothetical protein
LKVDIPDYVDPSKSGDSTVGNLVKRENRLYNPVIPADVDPLKWRIPE